MAVYLTKCQKWSVIKDIIRQIEIAIVTGKVSNEEELKFLKSVDNHEI